MKYFFSAIGHFLLGLLFLIILFFMLLWNPKEYSQKLNNII